MQSTAADDAIYSAATTSISGSHFLSKMPADEAADVGSGVHNDIEDRRIPAMTGSDS
jgi:hypothetical protein